MGLFGSLATWYFWAYYAVGLFVMASVLTVHLIMLPMPGRGAWLLVAGAALGVAGAAVGGMQAGPHPLTNAATGIAIIRIFWVSGITCGILAAGLYLWGMREGADRGLGEGGGLAIEGGDVGAQPAELFDGAAELYEDLVDADPPHDQVMAYQDEEGKDDQADPEEGETGKRRDDGE